LTDASQQRLLDRLLSILVAVTVVAFAAGSSSIPSVTHAFHGLRWVALVALFAGAAAAAWRRVRPPAGPTVAASVLVALAVLSSLWSVAPRTTFERALSLALLFATCLLLVCACAARRGLAVRLLEGVAAGAAAVGLLGLVVLAVDYDRAVQPATNEAPTRYEGFGQDPNTVGLLFAVVLPLAVWLVLRARTGRARAAAGGAVLLFAGSIVGTGSRGALVASFVGAVVVVLLEARRRWRALACVAAAFAAGVALSTIPHTVTGRPAHTVASAASQPVPRPGYLDAEADYPLAADVGQPLPGGGQPTVRRGLFATSGRLDAWRGALHEAARRPLVGHGFGTEQTVFVDRYYRFVGSLPENSYIGLALQLGAAGLLALIALLAVLARRGARALGGDGHAAAGLGVLAAGTAIAVVQSYLYSVGNLAAAAFWIPVFLLAVPGRDA
jgi:O-antigen ligase